jgi:hypothetical protein
MRVIYTSKGMSKIWGARYTLGARYISKNAVHLLPYFICIHIFALHGKAISVERSQYFPFSFMPSRFRTFQWHNVMKSSKAMIIIKYILL